MRERTYRSFSHVAEPGEFAMKALSWGRRHFGAAVYLNSNNYGADKYGNYKAIIGLGATDVFCAEKGVVFDDLKHFSDRHRDWLFGFFSYELKNHFEKLQSKNPDHLEMPLLHFFSPVVLLILEDDCWRVGCLPGIGSLSYPGVVYDNIVSEPDFDRMKPLAANIRARVSRERYLAQLAAIQDRIQVGDIYEMNYCVEFFAEEANIDPLHVYDSLNAASPTPFSCFYMFDNKYLMCASPERFMQKRGERLISQPIKGTSARSDDPHEDLLLKESLYNDPKERSENVMIVDLVRNDLSRTAKKGSVKVEDLYGIYSFRQVHQMISTVTSALHPDYHYLDAIRLAFPMGSMTGAPKIRAMQLIDEYEDTRRGLYSGAVGYISPEKNFDFNVVIRSIQYNGNNKYLGYMAGSAITIDSKPEKEYEEVLLKAKAMAIID